jgi:hypothetical protein
VGTVDESTGSGSLEEIYSSLAKRTKLTIISG